MRLPRLAPLLLLAALVAPTFGAATPGVDEGPVVALTYEVLSARPRTAPTEVSVDVQGLRVGAVWNDVDYTKSGIEESHHTAMVVRDGAIDHFHTLPWSRWATGTFDGWGRYHVFTSERYKDLGYYESYVTTWENGTWTTRVLDQTPGATYHPEAFEHEGVPFVVFPVTLEHPYTFGRIYRLDMATNEWEQIAETPFPTLTPRAVADSHGRIHLNAPDISKAYEQQYSVWDNGTWIQSGPAPAQTGWLDGHDIAIAPDDRPVFAYTDDQRRPRIVTALPEGGWKDELVTTRPLGHRPHVEVSPDGTLHLATYYFTGRYDTPTGANVYYHHKAPGGAWSTQPVLPVYSQLGHDLALDDQRQPVIGLPNNRLQTFIHTAADTTMGSIVLARPAEGLVPDEAAITGPLG